MNPSAVSGLSGLRLPVFPSDRSGVMSGPGSFGNLFDAMEQGSKPQDPEALKLPTRMEVRPIEDLQPGMAPLREQDAARSREFPGAAPMPRANGDGSQGPNHLLTPLSEALAQVNALNAEAERVGRVAAVGGDVDLHDVMIASEKASIAMSLTLQVRNKMVEAYQEVMRMQV